MRFRLSQKIHILLLISIEIKVFLCQLKFIIIFNTWPGKDNATMGHWRGVYASGDFFMSYFFAFFLTLFLVFFPFLQINSFSFAAVGLLKTLLSEKLLSGCLEIS